ncbi:MAG: PadR family transcriptional regulator [Brachybacterium sp.]|uniref:PadR family transcriptional regulator n=1 Tax=Brachybacterium sp. TaxID=1891286 RepID=UPI002648F924|nr:PadR family transcriptional regulator [Brachybacterium sp.]MDN5687147.1 PadR family transcriptional regulator [Brachybacterium sp.]
MSTAHALLGLLDRSPAYGYSLKQDYDQLLSPERPLAFGQVYASLARFERQGWAEILTVESGDGPERKLYGITPEGVTELDTWISTPQATGAFAASTLFARISIALLSGRDAEDVLSAQRGSHMVRMRELTSRRRGAEPAVLLQLDYELTHLDADLRWIQEAGQRLDALRKQWQGTAGSPSREAGGRR